MTLCTTDDCENQAEQIICQTCVSDLQAWLDKVPELLAELFVTMAKLDETAPRNREGGDGMTTAPGMPLRVGALEARSALKLWATQKPSGEWVPRTAKELATDQYAGKFLPMLMKLVEKAERVIDNPMEQHVFGYCSAKWQTEDGEHAECHEELRAAPDAATTECPGCGTLYDLNQLREDRRNYFRETPLPPKEVRQTLQEQTGVKVSLITFKNWVNRRKLRYVLEHIGTGDKERRLYFVVDLLATHQQIRE
ncbi:hypothetical protein [Glutamicibacter creatinolyticus]|uniref:hypothetical protein n=1 Tax=Glutamicibacter creatinolyticus TaxID=162496 RepID=UPI00321634C7